ncbi:PREDICTED: uncharacterized protein At4g04980-like isoform X1 [Camelina sativa]|nr:PREDICTED: uncharacterized protein At4g04980-like isoform X1 [Camelina sativa]XP_019095204.1 PREDICTED: uncharacterized protein At4g04980-like isoform X1 [Camelina sativa]XP_019095205.1 PREDICTED: uncharacterized protein At4g04980-like isoform X1 [Camelina sativa]
MVMRTMNDIHRLCPETVTSSQILDMRRAEVDKLLDNFYNALKLIGDSWMDDHEWIVKSKYRNSSIRKNMSDRLVEKVIAALDGLIKGLNERLEISNDEMKEKASPRCKTSSGARTESLVKQPTTPIKALSPSSEVKDFAISVSNLPRNVTLQALVKLSPIDVKRLAIQHLCQKEAQGKNGESVKENKNETDKTEKMEKAKEAILEEQDSVKNQTDDENCSKVSGKSKKFQTSLPPSPPLPPLPMAAGKGVAAPPLPPPRAAPPPLPMAAGKGVAAPPLPPPRAAPPPLPMAAGKGVAAPPLPPPGAAPPLAAGKGPGSPPPPPPGPRGVLGGKKPTSKLKRSTQLGTLFRFLKAKLEGKNPEVKSRGAPGVNKGGTGSAPASGKQGMAAALVEITKKSPYFQKIEEDVRVYMSSINELKTEITKFQNKDISELQKLHHRVESVLDKLEDERQVLVRCEGFPHSKLEAIRMAVALYSKLQGISKELKNWKIESPADQHLDKSEGYFAKIRKEIEALERTKAEEEKKFKANNIHFDFSILVQVKELTVDISSGCMELALKEKREASKWAKTLWRAFEFAFRVYKFAGGHDDRADKLTKEVGKEIELILGNQ